MVYGLLNSDLSTRNEYSSEKAHNRYLSIQKRKQGELKIGNDTKLAEFLENQIIKHKYSPYASLLAKQKSFKIRLSLKLCRIKTLQQKKKEKLYKEKNKKNRWTKYRRACRDNK